MGLAVGLGVAIPLIVIVILLVLVFLYYRHRHSKDDKPSDRSSRNPMAFLRYSRSVGMSNDALLVASPEKSIIKRDPTGQTTVASEFAIALPGYLLLDYAKDLRVDYQLSNGGGGVIYAGTLMNTAVRSNPSLRLKNDEVVIKHVPDRKDITPRENELMFQQEISTMAALSSNPNIVTLVGYTNMPRVIVMPLFKTGDLFSLVNKPSIKLHPLQLLEMAIDISTAMAAIHSIGVVHRDLKTPNCLVEQEPRATIGAVKAFGPRYKILITDFGVCHVRESSVSVQGQVFLNIFGLSVRYAPPEVFSRAMLNQRVEVSFDEECKSDVYAYAICIWELLVRQIPWNKMPREDIQTKVMAGERPQFPSESLASTGDERRNMIVQALHSLTLVCWSQDHFRRPMFAQTRQRLDDVLQSFMAQLTPEEAAAFTPSIGGPSTTMRLPSPQNTTDTPPPRFRPDASASNMSPRIGPRPMMPASTTGPPSYTSSSPKPPQPPPYLPAPNTTGNSPGAFDVKASAQSSNSSNVIVVENHIQLRSSYSYRANKPDEMSFELNQVVILLQRSHDGWMRVRDVNSGAEGWVPGNYFKEI